MHDLCAIKLNTQIMWQIVRNMWRTESQLNEETDENTLNHFLWKLIGATLVVVLVVLYIVIVHG